MAAILVNCCHYFASGLALLATASSQSASSGDGSISLLHGPLGGGGGPEENTVAMVTLDSSLDDESGGVTSADGSVLAYAGFIGQFYDVTGLVLTSASPELNEGDTLQLDAAQALNDVTYLTVPSTSVMWSVPSGPLTGIDANGVATADKVFPDTAATAQAYYLGLIGTLSLTVFDVNPDDYGGYAADGIDDDWQLLYFGEENPLAAPGIDLDGDEHDNRFEFIAGLIPTVRSSFFDQRSEPVPGQPGQTNIIFTPRLSDRTYTVKTITDLDANSWITLTGATASDASDTRTVTDPNSAGDRKFYKVEITCP